MPVCAASSSRAVNRANNFKDLKIFYFHNCWYSELYTGPRCVYGESVQTQWVINNLSRDYKVIVVGDASMAPSELTWVGGQLLLQPLQRRDRPDLAQPLPQPL